MHGSRSLPELSQVRQGALALKLTRDPEWILRSQRLRTRVFCEELGAMPGKEAGELDQDLYDPVCDHLLVLDTARPDHDCVIGTYRLLREAEVPGVGAFYTESEYDLSALLTTRTNLVELGRSCVDAPYRSGSVMKLLWRGIADYLEYFDIDTLFGCASFHGSDPAHHALGLSYLMQHHLAPKEVCPIALPDHRAQWEMIDKEALNVRRAFASLPPLIKGYIRLGGVVGEGAVIDRNYNTVDVCVILDRSLFTGRYVDRFASDTLKQALKKD